VWKSLEAAKGAVLVEPRYEIELLRLTLHVVGEGGGVGNKKAAPDKCGCVHVDSTREYAYMWCARVRVNSLRRFILVSLLINRSAAGLKPCLESFQAAVARDPERGACFFAVCRGKVSEGLDFADAQARLVILTGIPYAPAMDPKVCFFFVMSRTCFGVCVSNLGCLLSIFSSNKRTVCPFVCFCVFRLVALIPISKFTSYDDITMPFSACCQVKLKKEQLDLEVQAQAQAARFLHSASSAGSSTAPGHVIGLSGREWYSQQALRAVNQALGRVIRHRYEGVKDWS